jgi:tRNA(Ile)-lysidine synthase
MFLTRFTDFIEQNYLFAKADKVLLAVSGGKDSVLMAQFFKQAGYNFGIAHCNFGLRGDESMRDQNFVKALADDLQVPFYFVNFDTLTYAITHKVSIQMAARTLRYQFFEQLRQQYNYQKIAIAQHQNDAIETVLINLVRGTGIAGLHGISQNRANIIRPFLCFTSDEITQIIKQYNFTYVEDSSNASTKYMRNRIRLAVIPELKKLNPALETTFKNNLAYFSQLEDFLKQEVEKIRNQLFVYQHTSISVSVNEIKKLQPLIIYELLNPFGFNNTTVNDMVSVLEKHSGRQFFSATHQLVLDRENIIIKPITTAPATTINIEPSDSEVFFIEKRFSQAVLNQVPDNLKINLNTLFVDADKLIYPLTLRTWQQGDVFIPYGMNGEKKVSDFFINLKLSVFQKAETPILVNGNGQIIWVCGFRSDDRFKISATTKKTTTFKLYI